MKKHLGSIFVILSAVLFGLMPLMTRIAYAHGSNAYTVAFGRFFMGAAILALVILVSPKVSFRLTRRQALDVFKLSITYALMPVMLYMSYDYIDSGLATTLHFTYPVAVIVMLVLFCKQRPEKKQIFCMVLCLGGLALTTSPGSDLSVPGIVLAVGSGIVYASYIVLLGRSAAKDLHPFALAFWMSLMASLEIAAAALVLGKLTFALDMTGWTAELALALCATVFALVLFQKGLFLCGEVQASLLSTFEPLTGIVVGVIAFHEQLGPWEIAGMACILAAAVILVLPVGARAGQVDEK